MGRRSRRAGAYPSGSEGPLEARRELTQFSYPKERSALAPGRAQSRLAPGLEPGGWRRSLALPCEHPEPLRLRVSGPSGVGEPGVPAAGARGPPPSTPRRPQPMAPAAGPPLPGRRGLRRTRPEAARGRGLARCQAAAAGVCGSAERSKPRKCRFRGELQLFPKGPFRGEWRPARDRVPSSLLPAPARPRPRACRGGDAVSEQGRRGPARGLREPQRATRGGEGTHGEASPLPQPLRTVASGCAASAGRDATRGARSGLLPAPLTATICLRAPRAAKSRSRGRRRRPRPGGTAEPAARGGPRRAGLRAPGRRANRRAGRESGRGPGRGPGREQGTQRRAGPPAATRTGARREVAVALLWAGWTCVVCGWWREHAWEGGEWTGTND